MVILGIDPGSVAMGLGVVRLERGRYRLVDARVVRTRSEQPMAERLVALHAGVAAVITEHTPDAVAIEDIFHHKSSESALRLGQARGVAMLAAGQAGFEPVAYNTMVVKRTVGAHGKADKEGVARMVRLLLGAELDVGHDATDALAIAITHAAHSRTRGAA